MTMIQTRRRREQVLAGGLVAVLLLVVAAVVARALSEDFQRSRLRVSMRCLGQTHATFDTKGLQTHAGLAVCTVPDGARAVVLEVSNASPFALVRGRSPVLEYEAPAGRVETIPTGWSVLSSGACERFELEPPARGTTWKLVVACEPLRGSSYGNGPPDLRQRMGRIALWLQDRGIPVPVPGSLPAVRFSSEPIGP